MAIAQFTYNLSVAVLPILLGMILHEVAHGWMAWKMGDPTARALGRLTLNPLPHLDAMGTLFFVITAFASRAGGMPFIFGWAKPVPIDPRRFRNFRFGMLMVSVAGAGANLLLALFFALLMRLLLVFLRVPVVTGISGQSFLLDMCIMGVYINCTLAWFNLLPIPPLDGSKVLASLLPAPLARAYLSIERYGIIIVLLLFVTGLLPKVMKPLVQGTANLFGGIADFIF